MSIQSHLSLFVEQRVNVHGSFQGSRTRSSESFIRRRREVIALVAKGAAGYQKAVS